MFIFGDKDFIDKADKGKVTPLIYRLPIRNETPISAYLKINDGSNSFLLESAGGSRSLCKYSFVGIRPLKNIRTQGTNPLPVLREAVNSLSPGRIVTDIPVYGGAFGYLSYDVARYIEDLPVLAEDDLSIPESAFIFPGLLLVFDHENDHLYIIVNQIAGSNRKEALKQANNKLRATLSKLKSTNNINADEVPLYVSNDKPTSNLSATQYKNIVKQTKEYIFAGDIFQANMSVRFDIDYPGNPFHLYQCLRKINPSPFAAFFDFGDFHIVSSSPERLIVLKDGRAETRPIAGTRRRGDDSYQDDELTEDLMLSEKERAEHIMLVDLERNDLGKVCLYGTVRPSELMTIEKYSHVIHIVSNVRGQLKKDKDQFDLIRAMFPGGTITGCPKVRCMEIIEELEPTRRGPYTGSIGYFGFNGNMDMNITIRTFIVKDAIAYCQAGAGIVADSDPEREYFESVSKLNALFKAVGLRERNYEWEKLPM